MKFKIQNSKFLIFSYIFTFYILHFTFSCYAQEAKEPIIVNGDTVEYSMDSKEVTASGNVEVTYKGTKLTCEKLTVNTQTKDSSAEGNVRLEDEKGVIKGAKVTYNFQTKTGTIVDSEFISYPYFGKAQSVKKLSDREFIAQRGYMSTCNYDYPHYRIKSKRIDFFIHDKVQTKDDTVYVGKIPLLYIPQYNHSLKDPMMHVQLSPGKNKDWGPYILSAWRYNLTENIDGRIYLDYRSKLGWAEGFGTNYTTQNFGKGDFKFYYTQEKPHDSPSDMPKEYERYFMRWRHKWDIDERTNFISQVYKIVDERRKRLDPTRNILKDYFYREYEKDSQPLSYALLHHNFTNSSLDLLLQKRTNHWYDQLNKLPELKYTLPSLKLFDTPLYFENNSSLANFDKKATTSPTTADEVSVTRFDTTNKLSLPMKLAFIEFTPYILSRQTLYDKGADGASLPMRTIFYSGADLSTKFYRLFNVKSNFLGMDINGLRHIITPHIQYTYNHAPTIAAGKLKWIDAVDTIAKSNAVYLELSNKLQTKRKNQTIDFLDLRVSSTYSFYAVDPQTNLKSHGSFSDFLVKLKLIPYSWMRLEADATYNSKQHYFSNVNYDINFDLGKERSLGIGQRYQRNGGNEITASFQWRLNPKWKFSTYHRYNLGNDPNSVAGLKEQEYSILRDLHCWNVGLTYNIKKNEGSSIWFVFKLKAFPEMEFGFNQSYHQPQSGAQ
jgi:lipopolysaccharide assembly outer membrane protein LptD (OstA)